MATGKAFLILKEERRFLHPVVNSNFDKATIAENRIFCDSRFGDEGEVPLYVRVGHIRSAFGGNVKAEAHSGHNGERDRRRISYKASRRHSLAKEAL